MDIHAASDIVSKKHLRIIPKNELFKLIDLNSTNGTYVNGEKITDTVARPSDKVQLGRKGDVIIILKT